ncbi:hypothetical protein [Algiphilus sp.]|nr:hypothetical protein [Algiphilus sp.]
MPHWRYCNWHRQAWAAPRDAKRRPGSVGEIRNVFVDIQARLFRV